jgi:predicted DsbA family dithiol-disulfide isomerase
MDSVNKDETEVISVASLSTADQVLITYYTDPLCCWSWALEENCKRLRHEYQGQIRWKNVMAGMLQDWNSYNDPMNAINRPLQFGPVWMHASQISGVFMDSTIWHKDPPASSFPSCIAVKCAGLQSSEAEELLLAALRSAVMTKARNIARESVIMEIVGEVADVNEAFDLGLFKAAWKDGTGVQAFKSDLQQARYVKIGRYPTLTFTSDQAKGLMITGYRPYSILQDALRHMKELSKSKNPSEDGF